jgi:hypothetical protein
MRTSYTLASLGLDHLPIVFCLLDHIRSRNLSGPVDKFTNWERFQSLTSELISPRIQISSEEEDDKAARDFTAFIVSAYRPIDKKNYILGT